MRDISIIICGILLSVFLIAGCPQWLHQESWWVAFLHHFFHANIFHLAVNGLSLWLLFKHRWKVSALLAAYLFASLSWFCSNADPVGLSNILFALIGMRTPSISHKWWRSQGAVIFFGVNGLMVFFSHVSAITHLVSFFLGFLYSAAAREINRLSHDIGA